LAEIPEKCFVIQPYRTPYRLCSTAFERPTIKEFSEMAYTWRLCVAKLFYRNILRPGNKLFEELGTAAPDMDG